MLRFFREAFRQKTLAEWRVELGDVEICFGPVNTLDETFADPQVRHRRMIVEMETATGRTFMHGPPIKLSDTPATIRTPPATFGEHTDAVLAELGFDTAAVARLRADGIV